MRSSFIAAIISIFCTVALGQSDGYVASSNTRGLAPLNTFLSSDIDHINLANGGVNIRIPLFSRPGRGLNTGAALLYSSKFWVQKPNFNLNGGLTNIFWSHGTDFTFQTTPAGHLDFNEQDYECQFLSGGTTYNYSEDVFTAFIYRAADGSSYRFPNGHTDLLPDYGRHCAPTAVNEPGLSDDGSMLLDTRTHPWILYHKDGTKECVEPFTGRYPCPSSAFLIDTNGNVVNSSDTIGRAITVTYGQGGTITVSVKDSNGSIQNYTWTIQGGTSTSTQFPTTTEELAPVVQSTVSSGQINTLTLPDGRTYVFTFDPVFGEVSKVVLPTGGYIRYDYATLAAVDKIFKFKSPSVCCNAIDARRVSARHVSPTGNAADEQHWSFVYDAVASTTTVTDPLGNVTVHTFTAADGTNPSFEVQAQYYQGTSTLLKTETTTWQNESAKVLFSKINTSNFFQTALTDWRVGSVVTTLNDTNQVKQGTNTYDSYSFTNTSGTETRSRSNLLTKSDYDWGSGASGPLLRQTNFAYLNDNSTYANLHIIDRVSFKAICGSSGCGTCTVTSCPNAVAQAQYEFDNYTAGISASGAVQHGSSYNTAYLTRGNVTATKQWRNTDGAWLTTRSQYDDAGNIVSTTDPLSHTTQFSYADSWGNTTCLPTGGSAKAFKTQITDALLHTTKHKYNTCSGTVYSDTDQNNQVTSFSYDKMDRGVQAIYPDSGQTSICYSDVAGGTCYSPSNPITAVVTQKITTLPTIKDKISTTVYDGLGRVAQTQLNSDPDGVDYVDTTYDPLGRVSTVSNPYRSTSDVTYGITTIQYDPLGRVSKTIPPDGSSSVNNVSSTYLGNCATVADQAGKARKSCSDGLGRLTQAFEDPSSLNYETDYTYDALGNLLTVNQKGGDPNSANWRTRTFTYNSLSQLLSATNPESGAITYTYDNVGNVLSKTSPAPNQPNPSVTQTINYCHDQLDRLTSKWYTTPTCGSSSPVANYFYDQTSYNGLTIGNGIGRRTGMSDPSGATAWSHDITANVGWKTTEARTSSGVTKNIVSQNNLDGSLASVTYPSTRVVTFTVGTAGRLLSAVDTGNSINYVTVAKYAPQGALSSFSNGASINGALTYNKRLQPLQMYYTTGTISPTTLTQLQGGTCPTTVATILSTDYNFGLGTNDNGNVQSISNCRNTNRTQNFAYDNLNRIWQSYSTGPAWGEDFIIDPWGNVTNRNPHAGKTSYEPLNAAPATNNKLTGFGYDAAGNLTQNGTATYTYDAENRLVTAGGVTYTYDGDGNRVKKSNGTLYWGNGPLAESDLSGSSTSWKEYVFFGGNRLARRDASNSSVHYFFDDHLGSTSVVTNSTGATLEEDLDYYPYGGIASGTSSDHYLFTGKERDSESGLDYFGARYDASSLGRFMSPDPGNLSAIFHMNDPQSWNGYAYARNNPVTYTDPSGLDYTICDITGKKCGHLDDSTFDLEKRGAQKNGEYFQNGTMFHFGKDGSKVVDGTYSWNGPDIPGNASTNLNAMAMIGQGGTSFVYAGMRQMAYGAAFSFGFAQYAIASEAISQVAKLSMLKPLVSNPQLEALVGKLFQATDSLPGGTAGAVRFEQLTGDLLSEAGHFQKAANIYKAIDGLVKSGELSVHDQVIAKELLHDLNDAANFSRAFITGK
jgi:RHS repeat-associated protein